MLRNLLFLILIPLFVSFGKKGKSDTVINTITKNFGRQTLEITTETSIDTTCILDTLNITNMKTNFVITNDQIQLIDLAGFQGQEDSKIVNLEIYKQLLFQLEKAAIGREAENKQKPYTDFINRLNSLDESFSESDISMQVSLYAYEKYDGDEFVFECSLFNVLPLRENTYRGNNARFIFNQDNFTYSSDYLGNKPDIDYLMVDFGDGAGFRQINVPNSQTFSISIDINYSSVGKKYIKSKIKFVNHDEIFYSNSEINIETLSIPDPTYTLNLESDLSYQSSKAKGKAYIYRSAQNSIIKNPIIVVEGFDINENMNADELYHMLREQNLAKTLNEKGYDIVILNFTFAKDYIQKNAFLLVKLIQEINQKKDGKNELVVIGASMGGLVSRYALSYMEKHNMDHETRLYASFDSPQKGANIPLGVQHWFDFFASESASAKEFRSKLKSIAAKQMLLAYFDPYSDYHSIHQSFVSELEYYGFPQNLRKIAISNGTGTGIGLDYNGGDEIIHYHYNSNGAPSLIRGDAFAVAKEKKIVFDGRINIFGVTYKKREIKIKSSILLDNIPGGLKDTHGQIAQTHVHHGHITTNHPNHCFIPSISSLAIDTDNPFYNIKDDSNILEKTPFDDIYFPRSKPNTNQEHVSISSEMKEWLVKELIPENITLNDEKVWGQGEIKAKNSIRLLPGYDADGSSELKLEITND